MVRYCTLVQSDYKIINFGRAKAGRVVVSGQYHKAHGLFYGGFQLQNETKRVMNFIVNEWEWNIDLINSVDKGKLSIIDVHTGIGQGVDLLLCKKQKYLEKIIKLKTFPKEYFEHKGRTKGYRGMINLITQS